MQTRVKEKNIFQPNRSLKREKQEEGAITTPKIHTHLPLIIKQPKKQSNLAIKANAAKAQLEIFIAVRFCTHFLQEHSKKCIEKLILWEVGSDYIGYHNAIRPGTSIKHMVCKGCSSNAMNSVAIGALNTIAEPSLATQDHQNTGRLSLFKSYSCKKNIVS
ncbi:hypothetical protein EUGRSUZ_E03145 [Eucalyptus grandis]|uniref:Uncharacterized protein n=2 Tax=Eucalyptus grandis TaxID=71139 RepID=A0ACC3KZG4_EUCGR|nr:hypothetical protein EUGRSUZ_E03145 [Eucalyptus grandis]